MGGDDGVDAMKRKKAIVAVDARDATFAEWFVAQYGPRPETVSSLHVLFARAEAAEAEAHGWRALAEMAKEWDERYDLALKAWQASKVQP